MANHNNEIVLTAGQDNYNNKNNWWNSKAPEYSRTSSDAVLAGNLIAAAKDVAINKAYDTVRNGFFDKSGGYRGHFQPTKNLGIDASYRDKNNFNIQATYMIPKKTVKPAPK